MECLSWNDEAGSFQLAQGISRPEPSLGQALVKFLVMAVGPVGEIRNLPTQSQDSQPAVNPQPSAFCAVVVQVGQDCQRLQQGDYVYGPCKPLQHASSPFQDLFLVEEALVFKKCARLTPSDAACIGIGILPAAVGITASGKITLPEVGSAHERRDEWIVILSGSTVVGQFAIQLARLCGYEVAASCSPSNASIVMDCGATIAFNSRAAIEDQLSEIENISDGVLALVFDASGMEQHLGLEALQTSTMEKACFSTAGQLYCETVLTDGAVQVGGGMISILEGHIADGTIRPVEYESLSGSGWENVKNLALCRSPQNERKCLVVLVQDD